jgi:hypothetical protein
VTPILLDSDCRGLGLEGRRQRLELGFQGCRGVVAGPDVEEVRRWRPGPAVRRGWGAGEGWEAVPEVEAGGRSWTCAVAQEWLRGILDPLCLKFLSVADFQALLNTDTRI